MKQPSNKTFFYFGVLPALVFQLVGSYFYFIAFADTGWANKIYGLTKILILVWPLFWLLLGYRFKPLPTKHQYQKSLIYGLVSGLLIVGVIYGVFFLWKDYFLQFTEKIAGKTEDMGLLRKDYFLYFSVFLCVTHSWLEEFYWRWFTFRGLYEKFSPLWAALISSLFFAGHHYIVLGQYFPWWVTVLFGSFVGLGGAIWCWIYYRTGSLLGSWVSHLLVDAVIMLIGFQILF